MNTVYLYKKKWNLIFTLHVQVISRQMVEINVKGKIINLLEGNKEYLQIFWQVKSFKK